MSGEVTASLSMSVFFRGLQTHQHSPVCTLRFPHSEVSISDVRALAYSRVSSSGVGFFKGRRSLAGLTPFYLKPPSSMALPRDTG